MIKKSFFLWVFALVTLAVYANTVKANEIPCIGKEESEIFEPSELIRGYGIREGALVKLSVSSQGQWLLTLHFRRRRCSLYSFNGNRLEVCNF
tara:strand:- start:6597 stop:6875 length:279 start_codon:yes stop_codon:yes gene_type:complete